MGKGEVQGEVEEQLLLSRPSLSPTAVFTGQLAIIGDMLITELVSCSPSFTVPNCFPHIHYVFHNTLWAKNPILIFFTVVLVHIVDIDLYNNVDNKALEMISVVPTFCVLSELSLRKERRREALANTSQDTLSQVGGCDQVQK